MIIRSSRPGEHGIALLLVMFSLLLLTVIGLGMMYSTNMESSINSNYRDKQGSLYAALAGLQEARDRIQPATHNIVAPTSLPGFIATTSAGSAGLIYIVANNSVDPTNAGNPYFDAELCQEKVLGLTATPGSRCTSPPSPPSGQTWYQPFVQDSLSSSAPWNLSAPLDLKWVRISLKGNTMTPVSVDGSSNSKQVCWDGAHQVLLPAGYGANCAPNGGINAIKMTNFGSHYTSSSTNVTISAPPSGGTQATAHVVKTSATDGKISSNITITNPGAGYTSAIVQFTGGGGTGAAATATVAPSGSPISSVTLSGSGSQCYAVAPSVTLSAPSGSGATATASLAGSNSCVVNWAPSAHCTTTPPKNTTVTGVTLNGGGGSGFSGTLVFDNGGHISSSSIQNPGTSYTSPPTTVSGGTPALGTCTVTPNAVLGKLVASVSGSGGSGYTTPVTVTFSSGTGTAAAAPSAMATIGPPATNAGQITAITVTNQGTGYTGVPVITIIGTATTIGTATATLETVSTISGIVIDNPGSGYLADPTVTIDPPPGAGITATATASVARGTNYGKVYLLTSLAHTRTGARTMAQMEVASPVVGWNSTGALTLDGPNPTIGAMPNSDNFVIDGNDANSCGESADLVHPAIDGYDDPGANPPTHSVQTITSSLPRPDHYTGTGGAPSVQNGYLALGETLGSPTGLKSLTDALRAQAASQGHLYGSNPGSIAMGSCSSCATTSYTDPLGYGVTIPNPVGATTVVDYVDGDLTLSGNNNGYGILVVTGTLTMSGNFTWYGVVLVVGDGVASLGGGGNGQIVGTGLIAKVYGSPSDHSTLLSSLGSPNMSWNGGGGNGIQYDHCWSTNLMGTIPWTPPPSVHPLKVLSFRTLQY